MTHSDYRLYQDPSRPWDAPSSNTLYPSILLALVAGAYVLFKSLEILGYPVWLWLHQLAHMAADALRLGGALADSDSSDDTTHRGGGVLSNIFGLNSGSLLQKGVRGITGVLSSGPSDVPPGLGNWDNSCYQNSVIQGLASLPSLRDYLSEATTEYASLTAETTNGALYDMISKLNAPESHGQHFWIRGKLKSMSTFQQQDAQEYYSKILDALDEEVKKASSSKRRTSVSWLQAAKTLSLSEAQDDEQDVENKTENSQTPVEQPKIKPNPLDGLLAQRVGCTTCGHSDGLSLIPFNCLTVSLGRNYSYDISECLNEYTSLEYIDGVECAKCTLLKLKDTLTPIANAKPGSPFEARLNAVQEALDEDDFEDKTLVKTFNVPKKNWVQCTKSKQAVIARAPKSLVLHINRSIFDETNGMQYKNHAGVSYPRILDLSSWCLGNQPSGSQHPDMCLEEWPRDPTKSMLVGGDPPTTSPFRYNLRAAVTHSGSHGNGHYVCYRPHPRAATHRDANDEDAEEEEEEASGEQWWRFSDDSVYAVSEGQAHRGDVFMLFYERIDGSASPVQSEDSTVMASAVSEEVPLPPVVRSPTVEDPSATEIPLPDDDADNLSGSTPPTTMPAAATTEQPPTLSAPSTPTASHDYTDTETKNEISSEDALSTRCTSVSEADSLTPQDSSPKLDELTALSSQEVATPASKSMPSFSPHTMRTGAARGQGSRRGLPLVSAT